MLHTLVQTHPSGPTPDSDTVPLTAPAKVKSRTAGQNEAPDPIELQSLPLSAGNIDDGGAPKSRDEPPPPPSEHVRASVELRHGDLEMSRPATPEPSDDAVEVVPTVWEPFMNRFRLLAVCLANLGNALNDSAAGALIPYMEK